MANAPRTNCRFLFSLTSGFPPPFLLAPLHALDISVLPDATLEEAVLFTLRSSTRLRCEEEASGERVEMTREESNDPEHIILSFENSIIRRPVSPAPNTLLFPPRGSYVAFSAHSCSLLDSLFSQKTKTVN